MAVGSTVILGWTKEQWDGTGIGNKNMDGMDVDFLGTMTGVGLSLVLINYTF